jgi:hypothetical protein
LERDHDQQRSFQAEARWQGEERKDGRRLASDERNRDGTARLATGPSSRTEGHREDDERTGPSDEGKWISPPSGRKELQSEDG